MTQAPRPDRYAAAGVDIAAGNALVERIRPLAAATRRSGVIGGLGGFGALFDLAACGLRDPLLVATTDGVGTKLLLAKEADRLEGLGVDLVAMCVNDLVVQGAEPLFFLDYLATGRLRPEAAARVIGGIAEACRRSGCALIGGETAEMPGLYAADELDLAGFAVGAVERDALLPQGVAAGDVVLGLASSGAHANGYALIRQILREQGLDLAGPAPFAPAGSLADALLAPTRLYVRPLLTALRVAPGAIHALAHITGGGLVENLPRVLPEGTIARLDARRWPLPPLFAWLKRAGRLDDQELVRTFNAGIGMAVVVAAAETERVAGLLEAAGESVQRIGEISAGAGPARVEFLGREEAWADGAPAS
jgi:phosphoribosylformylglycinamidine cyclo-ligase